MQWPGSPSACRLTPWNRPRNHVFGLLIRRWTDAVSDRFGWIKATQERKGLPIEDLDAAIAAHALANDAALVTSNPERMVRIPHPEVEDWSAF